MALKVVWSPEAEFQLKEAVDYLEYKWTEKEIKKLFQKVEKSISIISNNPEMYKNSQRILNTRECVVSKHYSIFYTFDNEFVNIITFWNNAQNI